MANLALARGHRVTCYTMQWEGEKPKDLRVKILPPQGMTNVARCWHFAMQLQTLLKAAKHDCVLGFNRLPGLDFYFAADLCFQATARAKHPLLSRILPRYRTFIALEKKVFDPDSKTQILLLNAAQQADYQRYYHTQDERFHLIPPGIRIPSSLLTQEEARQSLPLPISANARCLLFVGTDLKLKGLDRVLKALAQFSEKTYLIVVGTKGKDFFQKQARKLNVADRVIFLGAVDDVYPLMQAADLLVHPAYKEAAGMVLIEALANGLPVLTTSNCGYASHILQSKAGVVVPGDPFDEEIFAKALAKFLDAAPNVSLRVNALDYVKTQELSQMAERVLALCEKKL